MAPWLFVLIALSSSHSPVTDDQCVIFDKPEELWAVSDLVFLGTVVATKATGLQGFHVTVDIATFRVDRAWKGKPERQVDIGGDAFFEKGRQYLTSCLRRGSRPRPHYRVVGQNRPTRRKPRWTG